MNVTRVSQDPRMDRDSAVSDFRITSEEEDADVPAIEKKVRKDPRKDPRNAIELQRLIRWLEVTEVIEPQSSYHTQFVSKWDACEMRRETGGFEDDDTDLSPIEESSDEGDEVWEIDWRDAMTQIKSSDVSKQHLREIRVKMEASRLLNSRLQDPTEVVRFNTKAIEKGTQRCMEELGLRASDDVSKGGSTNSEGKEMLHQLLPHMVKEAMHEKDPRSRVFQWDMIHQVTRSASDREPHPYGTGIGTSQLEQKRQMNLHQKSTKGKNKKSKTVD